MKRLTALLLVFSLALTACGDKKDRIDSSSSHITTKTELPNEPVVATSVENYAISAEVGDIIPFGEYDWRVLDVQDGEALLVTNRIIEPRKFDSTLADEWEVSELREYLNSDFYDNSFADEEKVRITENDTFTGQGYTVSDKVFLLEHSQAKEFFADDSDRIAYYDDEAVFWWLLPAFLESSSYGISYVGSSGELSLIGAMTNTYGGVRPALWLNLQAISTPTEVTSTEPAINEPVATTAPAIGGEIISGNFPNGRYEAKDTAGNFIGAYEVDGNQINTITALPFNGGEMAVGFSRYTFENGKLTIFPPDSAGGAAISFNCEYKNNSIFIISNAFGMEVRVEYKKVS